MVKSGHLFLDGRWERVWYGLGGTLAYRNEAALTSDKLCSVPVDLIDKIVWDKLESTTIPELYGHREIYLTEGAISDGNRLYGVFSSEEDAMSEQADSLCVGILPQVALTEDQIEIARRNSAAV